MATNQYHDSSGDWDTDTSSQVSTPSSSTMSEQSTPSAVPSNDKSVSALQPSTDNEPEETTTAWVGKWTAKLDKKLMDLEALVLNYLVEEKMMPFRKPQRPVTEDDLNAAKEPWDHSVPWPGSSYMIVEKATRRAIISNGDLWLEDGNTKGEVPAPTAHNTWLCVEQANSILFFNQRECLYLCCPDSSREPAPMDSARLLGGEGTSFMFVARAHPQGGYELLLLSEDHVDLSVVAVAEDNSHLHARRHGATLWEFHKVPSS